MLYCNKCGLRLEAEESICLRCGQPIEIPVYFKPIIKKIYCEGCGQELQPDWEICPKCLKSVKIKQKLEKNYKEYTEKPYKMAGLCVLIFGIIFTIYFMSIFVYSYHAYYSEYGPGMHGIAMRGSAMMVGIGFTIIFGGVFLMTRKIKKNQRKEFKN
ncbi:MAG: zinc ribbon domain-containing protein [Promethearchaeota archaeon]